MGSPSVPLGRVSERENRIKEKSSLLCGMDASWNISSACVRGLLQLDMTAPLLQRSLTSLAPGTKRQVVASSCARTGS